MPAAGHGKNTMNTSSLCAADSEIDFIDLTANPPAVTGKLSVGSRSGDTFYPAGVTISPDGLYAVVTSSIGGNPPNQSTQISRMLVVSVNDHVVTQDLNL